MTFRVSKIQACKSLIALAFTLGRQLLYTSKVLTILLERDATENEKVQKMSNQLRREAGRREPRCPI